VARPAVAVQVLTTYPGMSAQWVEKTITSRVERRVNQAPGVTRIESKSIEGASLLTVYFRDDVDPNSALALTNSLALAALPALPEGTLPPLVLPCDGSHPQEIGDILKLLAAPGAAVDRPRD
jgi:multidrug efflux pump subunit AcrB